MSAMFEVKVASTDDSQGIAKFELTIINADQQGFPDSASFAIMLLLDPIREFDITDAPILTEIPLDDVLDFNMDIIREKEKKIVKRVELSDSKHWPLSSELKNYSDDELKKFWNNKESLPSSIVTIATVKPGFVSHLSKGQQWESGAFSLQ